jgi:uncharacterized repeat protein (TIGR03803 family)
MFKSFRAGNLIKHDRRFRKLYFMYRSMKAGKGGSLRARSARADHPTTHLIQPLERRVFLSGNSVPVFNSLRQLGPSDGVSAYNPSALVEDSAGNIYGTAGGGTYGDGVLYELSGRDHTTFSQLISFTGNFGSYMGSGPGSLVVDSSGNLFGTTSGGPTGNGTIFELAANHTTH